MPQPARTFVEFGHDEISLIWIPDVHITNLHQGMMTTHEEVPALPRRAVLSLPLRLPREALRLPPQ